MYNILYILHRTEGNTNIYWTQTGNDSQYSKDKRKGFELEYCGAEFEQIAKCSFKAGAEEAKKAQLLVNETFKKWTNIGRNDKMQITINKEPDEFVSIVKEILDNRKDEDKLNEIQKHLIDDECNKKYRLNKYLEMLDKGYIYLIRCSNNKLKIGYTNSICRRLEELRQNPKVQALELVDSFSTDTMSKDEALLHRLCSKYKCDSNGEITCLQDHGNSELFEDCKEVIDIWNKYKVNNINISCNDVTM